MEIEGAEVDTFEGYVDWRKRPVEKLKHGGIVAAGFVLVSEVFENLAFIANAQNLVNYIYGCMHFPLAESANTVTNFMGTSFLLPLLGGFLCDTYITTYVTVIIFTVIEFIGLGLLTIEADYPSLKPSPCKMEGGQCRKVEGAEAAMLYIALYLVALGVGGVKGSLPVHGAEQFHEDDAAQRKLRSNFFNWFLFSMCAGSLLAVTFVVWVQDNRGWQWGFGLSTISIVLVLVFFVAGTRLYRSRLPQGSPLTRIAQVIVAAIHNRGIQTYVTADADAMYLDVNDKERTPTLENTSLLRRTRQFRFLDKASIPVRDPKLGASGTDKENPWRLCTVTQVEEVKIMLRVIPIFGSTIMMNCCLAQLQTFSVRQAKTMDRRINGFLVPAASLPAIPVISMMLLIPVYDLVFVPLARRLTGKDTGISHLQRVGVGLLLSILAMAVAAVVEIKRKRVARDHDLLDSSNPLPMTFLWIGFQYLVLGIADMFTLAGLMEFFYTQAPTTMRSLATALSWTSISMGYFLSSVLVNVVNGVTKHFGDDVAWLSGNNLNRNHLERFYWLLFVLSTLNFVHYLLWAFWYRYKAQRQPEPN